MEITYRPLQKKDLIQRFTWLNRPEVRKFLGPDVRNGSSLEYHKKWFDDYFRHEKSQMFTIVVDGKPIGNIGINDLDMQVDYNGGIHLIIGEPEYWSKGIGTKAMKFIINYAFNEIKLHKLFLVVAEDNIGAIKCYEKLGFQKEGILREQTFIDGKFKNEIWMGLIKKESKKPARGYRRAG